MVEHKTSDRRFYWPSMRACIGAHLIILFGGLTASIYYHSLLAVTATMWAFAMIPGPRRVR